MNNISRKKFLKDLSYISLGIVSFSNMLIAAETGNLILKNILPVQNDSNGILKLIKGFNYSVISEKGQVMSDGLTVPDYADGMASFNGKNGNLILIRNHEIGRFKTVEKLLDKNPIYKNTAYIKKYKNLFYDINNNQPCGGGTSTIVYNPKTQKVENEYMSLLGTLVNCAGGKTPWGTWISCEETVEKKHGYNFEVTPYESIQLSEPIPLKEMGRFRHEAVAIDNRTSIAYQTEDQKDGLIYRFIPNVKEKDQWDNLTSGAWAHYDNDSQHEANRGKLYNWFAVETGKLCPTGWHVPTDAEWTVLTDYLAANGHNGKEAIALRSAEVWAEELRGTDDYGWNGIPGGFIGSSGVSLGIDAYGFWWSASEYNTINAWSRNLGYHIDDVDRDNYLKGTGLSVRCIKD